MNGTPGTPSFGRSAVASVLLLIAAGCASAPPPAPSAPAPAAPPPPVAPPPAEAEPSREALRAQAEEELRLAVEAGARADGTTAELRLIDARETSRRLVALAPEDAGALLLRGRILKESKDFGEAHRTLRAGMERLRDPDGQAFYDMGYCLAFDGKFQEALDAFVRAESLLGPTIDVVVNAAICEEHLGRRPKAVARLRAFYETASVAGRGGGAEARRALEKTWDLTVVKRDFEAGKAAFRSLAEEHPGAPEPSFMLGNLLSFLKEDAAAADAYALSLKAADRPVARFRLAAALFAAGKVDDAEETLRACLADRPVNDEAKELVLALGRWLLVASRPTAARELAEAALAAIPDDVDLLILAGDGSLDEGDVEAALASFLRAKEEAPFSREAEARAARATLAVLRAGKPVEADVKAFVADADPVEPGEPTEMLAGFDESAVFVRAEGVRGARIADGAMSIPLATAAATEAATPGAAPPGDPGQRRPARPIVGPLLRVEFSPVLDGRNWESLSFTAWTPSGNASLRASILDGWDEAGSGFARSRWPADGSAVPVGPKRAKVTVPLAGLKGFSPNRPLPPLLQRLRAFLLQVEPAAGDAAKQILLDDLVLRAPDGTTRLLADFEETPPEIAVLYDGTIVPFERTLSTAEQVAGFQTPGTTVYAPHIVVGAFDPAFVGGGTASLRIHHGEGAAAPNDRFGRVQGAAPAGKGSVTILLRPARDLSAYRSITFMARGAKGGERLRLRLLDPFDLSLEGRDRAKHRPPIVFPRTAEADGPIALEPEWRRYRLYFENVPDLDVSAVAALVFDVGEDVGNGKDAVLFLDGIGLEE